MAATVLIIDDDQSLNNMLADVLDAAGFRVLREFRGSRGLHTAIKKKPDVVILDVKTPDVQGLEALHVLRLRRVPTRVIVYTGESQSQADIVRFIRAGAADYIVKTGNPDAVVNAVERTLALDATLDEMAGESKVSELLAKLEALRGENGELKQALARQHRSEMCARALQATLVIAILGAFRYFDIVTLHGAFGIPVVGVVFAALFLPVDRLLKLTVTAPGTKTNIEIAPEAREARAAA